jgi:hypothetical protein
MEVDMTAVTKPAQSNAYSERDAARVSLSTVPQSPVRPDLPILPESATIIEVRRKMIAEAAYYLAAQRGFAPGHELDDWLAAESAVDRGSLQGARLLPVDRRRH